MKFTQELKEKWLTALRSGDFVQFQQGYSTRDQETNRARHCCLAVLDTLLAKDGPSVFSILATAFRDQEHDLVANLIKANDHPLIEKEEDLNYSNVIPLIEALPVQD